MSVRLKVYPFKRRDVIALIFNHCLGSNNSTACVLERGTQLTLNRETTKLVFDIRPAAKMTQNNAQTGEKKKIPATVSSPLEPRLPLLTAHRRPAIVHDRWSCKGETDERQGTPRHFTFPLLQPDRTWITVNDSPPRPPSHLTCHRLSPRHLSPPPLPPTPPALMGPRWVAELPQDPAGSGGQSVLRKRDGGECAEGGRGRRQEWRSSVTGIQIYKAADSESGLGVGQQFLKGKRNLPW